MKLDIQQLNAFQAPGGNEFGSVTQVAKHIRSTLKEIKDILQAKGGLSHEIVYDMKDIITRATIIDQIINPVYPNEASGEFHLIGDDHEIDFEKLGITFYNLGGESIQPNPIQAHTEERRENLAYYHLPSVGVFHNDSPILLNTNYIEALDAESYRKLTNDIQAGEIGKYYDTQDRINAAKLSKALKLLKGGEGYKNLVLRTAGGKLLSWNSFGSTQGLEVRIGSDISHGIYQPHPPFDKRFEGLSLNTKSLVNGFLLSVNKIIGNTPELTSKLVAFGILGTIIDKIWNSGQFLMNVTVNDEVDGSMLFNTGYAQVLKRTKEEILWEIEKGTLWGKIYDEETLRLIEGLMKCLDQDGYYISDFGLKDAEGKIMWFSWIRFQIKDKEFGINRTFGIGTNVISKDTAELQKLTNT